MFTDRADAGRQLARAVLACLDRDAAARHEARDSSRCVVLGLPRGGVPVAAVVADALHCTLDVIVVRKLGVPAQPELAMGAIGEGGTQVLDHRVLVAARISPGQLAEVTDRERDELTVRVAALRGANRRLDLRGKIAVIVDDGMATGSTARVACAVARQLGAMRVIVALPVAPPDTTRASIDEADDVVCVLMPEPFVAVGAHYRDFTPPSDAEVAHLVDARRHPV